MGRAPRRSARARAPSYAAAWAFFADPVRALGGGREWAGMGDRRAGTRITAPRSQLHRSGFAQRADQHPSAERDLEGVVLPPPRASEGRLRRARHRPRVDGLALERLLRGPRP